MFPPWINTDFCETSFDMTTERNCPNENKNKSFDSLFDSSNVSFSLQFHAEAENKENDQDRNDNPGNPINVFQDYSLKHAQFLKGNQNRTPLSNVLNTMDAKRIKLFESSMEVPLSPIKSTSMSVIPCDQEINTIDELALLQATFDVAFTYKHGRFLWTGKSIESMSKHESIPVLHPEYDEYIPVPEPYPSSVTPDWFTSNRVNEELRYINYHDTPGTNLTSGFFIYDPHDQKFTRQRDSHPQKKRGSETGSVTSDTSNTIVSEAIIEIRLNVERQCGDELYKPTWIRGKGKEREGRCDLCDPPVWFNLKQSTYWYSMRLPKIYIKVAKILLGII
jgi:hypothetical protein